jgi:DNA (cytosine-5)-methyltransferase 1
VNKAMAHQGRRRCLTGRTIDVAPLAAVSLCSGTGGVDLGIELACGQAIRPVLYVEREAYATAVLARRMEEGALAAAPVWSDVKTLCSPAVRDYLRVACGGVVDLVYGGYPCQPFSFAGKRAGGDDPRHLWPWIARAVAEWRPALCFFENVSGHLSLGFREVVEELESLGYEVAAGLFTAAEMGAPHRRERLFILARSVRLPGGERAGRERVLKGSTPVVQPGGDGRREHEPGSRPDRRTVAERAGVPVADFGGGAIPPSTAGRTGDAERAAFAGAGPVGDAEWRGEPVAPDTDGPDDALALYPPGPADAAGWRAVLGRRPEVKPAVCVVADGPAAGLEHRNHALRAAGNGVVPQCVAAAFLSLFAALVEPDNE